MPFGGLLTVGLISAGASIYAAHKQSSSAQKAADQQTAATDKAIELRKPYVDTGTKAFTTLGALMGLGGGGGQAQTASTLPAGPTNHLTGPAAPPGFESGAISDPSVNHGFAAQGAGGQGLLPGGQGQFQTSQAASSYPSYTPHTSPVPMVTVTSPDGQETQQVPADQSDYWRQKGATIHG